MLVFFLRLSRVVGWVKGCWYIWLGDKLHTRAYSASHVVGAKGGWVRVGTVLTHSGVVGQGERGDCECCFFAVLNEGGTRVGLLMVIRWFLMEHSYWLGFALALGTLLK